MLLQSLKRNQLSFVFVLIFGGLLWLKAFFNMNEGGYFYHSEPMPFMKLLVDLQNNYPVAGKLISLSLVLIQSFMLIRINSKYMIINTRGYLISFVFLFIVGSNTINQSISPTIIVNFFVIFAINTLFSTYKMDRSINTFFNLGLIMGIGSLFYFNLIFFIPFIWFSMMILRAFYWREWIVGLLGILMPYMLLISYYFILKNDFIYVPGLIMDKLGDGIFPKDISQFYSISNIVIGFILLFGIQKSVVLMQRKKVSVRKYFSIFYWLILFSLLIGALVTQAGMDLIVVFAIPASFIISNYFNEIRESRRARLLFFSFVCLIFVSQYSDFIFQWI